MKNNAVWLQKVIKIKSPEFELRSRTVAKGGNPTQNLKIKSMDENKPPEKYIAMA